MSKYYDYLKKYDSRFLNRYESWTHHAWGRKSNYMQLLNLRAYTLMTSRNIVLPGFKLKGWFFFVGSLICIADIWGIWIFQEVYNKYTPQKWVWYQPYLHPQTQFLYDYQGTDTTEEKRPMTRLRYADAIKIVYDGVEDQDTAGIRRFRYR